MRRAALTGCAWAPPTSFPLTSILPFVSCVTSSILPFVSCMTSSILPFDILHPSLCVMRDLLHRSRCVMRDTSGQAFRIWSVVCRGACLWCPITCCDVVWQLRRAGVCRES